MHGKLLAATLAVVVTYSGQAAAQQMQAQPMEAPCPDCPPAEVGREPNVLKKMWIGICRDFKRSNAWPDPFVTADRESVRVPFEIMTASGWRLQNTLSDHHFDGDSIHLTEAGRLKVAAIINDSPIAYRAIFVLRSNDPEVMAGRVASVQEQAARVLGDRPPVPIFETYEKPRGAAAMYVDEVTRRYQATTPDPRLPQDNNTDMSGDLPN